MPLWQISKSTYVLIKFSKSFSQPGANFRSSLMSTATAPYINTRYYSFFLLMGYVFV